MSTFENYTSSLELALKIILPELDNKVEIRVRQPAADGARIQSRKGYFAPYRTDPASK